MKILINRQPVDGPWGGGNLWVKALIKHGPEFGLTFGTKLNQMYDAIFIIDPRRDELGIGIDEIERYKLLHPQIPVFQRINECDERKGEKDQIDPILRRCSTVIDHTFWVSNWIKAYHRHYGWGCSQENESVIYNGVDSAIFNSHGLKRNNGKINIVTAHWSDNPWKGKDVHDWIDNFVGQHPNEFTYTFIGRHSTPFKNANLIPPLDGEKLAEELACYDICINGSRQDPAPNAVIESIACGLPTYAHKDGGGALELAGRDHMFNSPDELEKILLSKKFEPNTQWKPQSWET